MRGVQRDRSADKGWIEYRHKALVGHNVSIVFVLVYILLSFPQLWPQKVVLRSLVSSCLSQISANPLA